MFDGQPRRDDKAHREVHLLRIGIRQGDQLVSAALDCSNVQEVIDSPRLEPLPLASPVMRGVVEVRGVPVPVVPLGFGAEGSTLEHPEGKQSQRLVICGLAHGVVAFQVAQIHGIVVCDQDELHPLPASMAALGGVFCCEQVIREEEGYRFVIDPTQYLSAVVDGQGAPRVAAA